MPISSEERITFSKSTHEIAWEILNMNQEHSKLLFKVLAHAVKNNEGFLSVLDDSIFENPNIFKEKFSFLLQHALIQATSLHDSSKFSPEFQQILTGNKEREYTPREISVYFGVSTTTIHNWIREGRFKGITLAGRNKHNYIPGDTIYTSPSGKKILVSDVINMWEKQEEEQRKLEDPSKDKLGRIIREIAMYEEKYKGEFKNTLGSKKTFTSEEETDAQVWKYLLEQQDGEFGDTQE